MAHKDDYPIDKLSRWLGFIQGCLVCKGLCDVDTERSYTREFFRKAYIEEGTPVPVPLDLPTEDVHPNLPPNLAQQLGHGAAS